MKWDIELRNVIKICIFVNDEMYNDNIYLIWYFDNLRVKCFCEIVYC